MGVVIRVREMGHNQSLNGSTPLVNWERVVDGVDGSERAGFMVGSVRGLSGSLGVKKVIQFLRLRGNMDNLPLEPMVNLTCL